MDKEKKAKEYIVQDIIRRFKEELKVNNYVVKVLNVKEQNDEEVELTEILQEYLEEYTEKTENEKDILGSTDLYEKWQIWSREKYKGRYAILNTTNISIQLFGKNLGNFYERGVEKTRQNKTIRGFKYIRYKSTTSKVGEFMKKFIMQTEDGVLDRIPIKEIYYTYLKWGEGSKMGPETFNTHMQKAGTYKTKQACLKQEVTKLNGKQKIEKKGGKYNTQLCVMKVKWIPGEKESLDDSVVTPSHDETLVV